MSDTLPVMICVVGEHRYAIPVADILEVSALVQMIPLPESPPEVRGVVNRHGSLIPILDLRLCLGQEAGPLTLATLFVVVRGANQVAGLVVDDVSEVMSLSTDSLTRLARSGPYIRGMAVADQKPLFVFDVAALLQTFAPVDLPVEGNHDHSGSQAS